MSSLWTVSPNKFLGPPSISISVFACCGICSLLLLRLMLPLVVGVSSLFNRLSLFIIRLSFVTVSSMVLLFPFAFAFEFEDCEPGMSKIPSSPTSHCPAIKRKLPLFRIPSKARCCCTEDFEPLVLAVPYVPPDVVRSNLVTFKPAKVAPKDKCVTSFLLVDVLVEAPEVRSRRPKILGPLFSSSSSSSSFILIFFCVKSSGTTSSNNKNHSCGSY
mmetsp:Transcript_28245/g.32036  ORF Transcript_28245/g.32036 Transcript_28245/m.32036 type:complete len:216 (+) Transcript_28245:1027-1674(+)